MNERYSRQILFEGIGEAGQQRLLASRVLVVGCGALGSAQAEALARAGVGRLRIVDRDFVEWSNLQRQTMFTEQDAIERIPKAVACGKRIAKINSDVEAETHIADVKPSAREIGAVNTIVIEGDELHGYNTDAPAFISPLQSKIKNLRDARVAIIGAGGAARSALWSLRKEEARVVVFARRPDRAQALARNFDANAEHLAGANFDGFDLVVNATPLGTRGDSETETPVVAAQLRGAHLAYDLVYNPTDTRFLREAAQAGCEVVGGLEMLVAQATAQFKLWTGEDAPLEVMRAAAEKRLQGA
jgi:shikimate dehydrogenase